MKHELEPLKRIQTERYGEQPRYYTPEEQLFEQVRETAIMFAMSAIIHNKRHFEDLHKHFYQLVQEGKLMEQFKPTPPETGNDFDGLDI